MYNTFKCTYTDRHRHRYRHTCTHTHTCTNTHTHTHTMLKKLNSMAWQCSLKNHRLTKTQHQTLKTHFSMFGQGSPSDSQSSIYYKYIPWVSSRSWRWDPITENTAYLGHRTQMIWAVSDLKASFMWSSFHGSRKYYVSSQGREAIKLSYLVVTPVNKTMMSIVKYKGAIRATHLSVATNSSLMGLKAHSRKGISFAELETKPDSHG